MVGRPQRPTCSCWRAARRGSSRRESPRWRLSRPRPPARPPARGVLPWDHHVLNFVSGLLLIRPLRAGVPVLLALLLVPLLFGSLPAMDITPAPAAFVKPLSTGPVQLRAGQLVVDGQPFQIRGVGY